MRLAVKHTASINPDVLEESTPRDTEIEYIDIGNVLRTGEIVGTQRMTFGASPSRARRLVRHGDTIVSTVRTYLEAIAYMQDPPQSTVVSTGFAVLRPRANVDSRFLYFAVRAKPFIAAVVARSTGVSYPAIAPSDLGGLHIDLPPLPEQRAIAAFLDRETAHIDELITRNTTLIERLTRRIPTLASQECSTPSAAAEWTQPATVDWLTSVIPSNWRASRCKHLFTEVDERSISGQEPLLLVSIAIGVLPRDQWTNREARADTLEGYKLVRPGDLVINRMRAFQGALGVSRWHGIVSPDYSVLRPQPGIDARYYAYLLRTPPLVDEMRLRLRGIGGVDMGNVRTPRINMADFGQIVVPVPPLHEQLAISDRLNRVLERQGRVIMALNSLIDRLKERRQALITAAVAGQIGAA